MTAGEVAAHGGAPVAGRRTKVVAAAASVALSEIDARALGGASGTDGTGRNWILDAFRPAKRYFPDARSTDAPCTGASTTTLRFIVSTTAP